MSDVSGHTHREAHVYGTIVVLGPESDSAGASMPMPVSCASTNLETVHDIGGDCNILEPAFLNQVNTTTGRGARRSTRSTLAAHRAVAATITPEAQPPEPTDAAELENSVSSLNKRRKGSVPKTKAKETAATPQENVPQKPTKAEAISAAKLAAQIRREEARKKKEEAEKQKEDTKKKKKEEARKEKEEARKEKETTRKEKEGVQKKKAEDKAIREEKLCKFALLEVDMHTKAKKHTFPSLFKVRKDELEFYAEREFLPTTEQQVNDFEVEETLALDTAEEEDDNEDNDELHGHTEDKEAELLTRYVAITAVRQKSTSKHKGKDIEMSVVSSDDESTLVSTSKGRGRQLLNPTISRIKTSDQEMAKPITVKQKGDKSNIDIAKKQKVTLTIASDDTEIMVEDGIDDYFVANSDDQEMHESTNFLVSGSGRKTARTLNITNGFKGNSSQGLKQRANAGK